MNTGSNELKILTRAIEKWEKEGTITSEQAHQLKEKIQAEKSERQHIAQYFFIVAISCAVLAFGAIFIDEKILEKLKTYFSLSNIFIASASLLLSIIWFAYTKKVMRKISTVMYEAYIITGTTLSVIALVYIFKDIGPGLYYHKLLLSTSILLILTGIIFKSRVIWTCALACLTVWFGSYTTLHNSGYMFLGMNYPFRMVIFSLVIILFSVLSGKERKTRFISRITFLYGILLLFASMWAVSVFGNYGHLDEWIKVRQQQVIPYALFSALCSVTAFYIGIRRADEQLRDIGIFSLLINLYTRYFEYFWDHTNKGLFFLILAVSFYFTGKYLNKKKSIKLKT